MQRKFRRDLLICVIPCLLAALLTFRAWQNNSFKLGIDLRGGTILIYEVDQERERQRRALEKGGDSGSFSGAKTSQALAEAIKRRVDPDDVKNIIVRPAGDNRIEVILPAGSPVDETRRLIEQVGSLEFRIVANDHDDAEAFRKAEEDFAKFDPEFLRAGAIGGDPPPPPIAEGEPFVLQNLDAREGDEKTIVRYGWVELHRNERSELGLLNKNENLPAKDQSELWKQLAEARKTHSVVRHNGHGGNFLIYSRESLNANLPEKLRGEKKYEYFILTRISDKDRLEVDGSRVTITATPGTDGRSLRPAVNFTLNTYGGQQFGKITSRNKPDQDERMKRQLAIILNGELISFPTLQSVISDHGQITGDFDQPYVNDIVKLLRSGALPATMKQKPVAENTIGPTLGADTIKSGTRAIGAAYLFVLGFMLVYYRFAGFVACVALLMNLLLTVGFMVAVNATFTLPGLAGLVLMLGMAVDANILIYERLREERDRGANLQMAIRNAYDRAFGTIIDTHLTSIFTAIVLYIFGNDQLRGFGVSLAAGLVISLFTSLFMTHLIFDYWVKRNWLTKLRMMRILTRPKIDFMKLRKVMFPITGALTILGLGVFLLRGEKGLNVDFVGGTVYGGQLKEEVNVETLRGRLSDKRQESVLKVASVTKDEAESRSGRNVFDVVYEDGEQRKIELALDLEGDTPEQKLASLKARLSQIPDWSVEQNFTSDSSGDTSKFFTIRTTEKEPELVQAAVDRLFRDDAGKSMLPQTELTVTRVPEGKDFVWLLKFTDPATSEPHYVSEAYIRTLLEREFRTALAGTTVLEPFRLQGSSEAKDGRYSELRLTLSLDARNVSSLAPDNVDKILAKVAREYNQRPQPERLETFDPTLAGDMRTKAFVAILASWIALLLYLWFRFGNWTFGLAAIICLIHDLCFTIGAIAFSHYLHDTKFGQLIRLQDFKIDFVAIAALLTLVGYSVNEIIVNFARIREVRGKNPLLTPQMINDSVNQTLSRTMLTSATVWLVVMVLYFAGGDGVHLFAFVMVVGVMIGTYSSIYVASPLLLLFGEGRPEKRVAASPVPQPVPAPAQ
jgi:SecD/SecF fusion protein